MDPFLSRYDGTGGNRRTATGQPEAKPLTDDFMQRFEARRAAGRRPPSAKPVKAPEPPSPVPSPLPPTKPPSVEIRPLLGDRQRITTVNPLDVVLVAVIPQHPEPAPVVQIDDEALRLLDLIAARYAGDLSGVTVAKGVTISNGPVFLTASRRGLTSTSIVQRRTAAANIRGAAAMLGAA